MYHAQTRTHHTHRALIWSHLFLLSSVSYIRQHQSELVVHGRNLVQMRRTREDVVNHATMWRSVHRNVWASWYAQPNTYILHFGLTKALKQSPIDANEDDPGKILRTQTSLHFLERCTQRNQASCNPFMVHIHQSSAGALMWWPRNLRWMHLSWYNPLLPIHHMILRTVHLL